jgi:phosphate transport system substrate-binding protein
MVVGGVVPVINIRGIKPGQLKLSGKVLTDIFLGRIRKWNDGRIKALNPDLAMPGANITVVYRSDRSGSSLLWSEYLSRSSESWQTAIGASVAPKWPTGVGGDGNEGVATYVERTRFALGYVEYAFAHAHNLSDVALINHFGRVVRAGRETFRAAAEAASWDTDITQQMATDLPCTDCWPITGASFILMEKSPERGANARAVLQFFDWALHRDPTLTLNLDYLPLPEPVATRLPQIWHSVLDGNGRPIWPK